MVTVCTVGHSSRTLGELLSLIALCGGELVVDLRRLPGSRRLPWFRGEAVAEALRERGIGYLWMGETLGGFRRLGRDVEDDGSARCWENQGFRAYAIYVSRAPEARASLHWLMEAASARRLVLLCREKVPWRCHRRIVSDVLAAHGVRVLHVIEAGRVLEHRVPGCLEWTRDGWIRYR